MRSSYLHNGNTFICKMTSLYWIGPQDQYILNTESCHDTKFDFIIAGSTKGLSLWQPLIPPMMKRLMLGELFSACMETTKFVYHLCMGLLWMISCSQFYFLLSPPTRCHRNVLVVYRWESKGVITTGRVTHIIFHLHAEFISHNIKFMKLFLVEGKL